MRHRADTCTPLTPPTFVLAVAEAVLVFVLARVRLQRSLQWHEPSPTCGSCPSGALDALPSVVDIAPEAKESTAPTSWGI